MALTNRQKVNNALFPLIGPDRTGPSASVDAAAQAIIAAGIHPVSPADTVYRLVVDVANGYLPLPKLYTLLGV